MTVAPGSRLGPYEVISPLGQGGMGEVFRARDTRLGREVALKILPDRLAGDPQFRERFEREARAISRITNPHICTVFDVGESGGVSFIVMELVEGDTLRVWMRKQARPDVASVTRIGSQVARALAAAHAAGIVHRDIKPDNVIVQPDGSVKVLDFGVAKLTEPTESDLTRASDTAAGIVVGTTEYMSPEQARGIGVDARADVFSLGVVLYELLAGAAPFRGSTTTDTVIAILQHDPPPVTRHRPEAGSGLSRIIATCLEKEPGRRYATGRELAHELEQLAHAPAAAAPPSIAVLPFVNMSTDAENEYFCDGIAEDLISALTKIEHLHVAARTSSFAFKGRQVDLKEIGRLLNVRTVLEGSVRKAGNRLRVTAQLVKVEDGYQIWSERYDRQLEDVFAIQDEISAAIITALKGKLLGEEKAALGKHQTENVEAFQLYMRGRHHWYKWTAEGLAKAKEYWQQALAIDPQYALPHVGLADVVLAAGGTGLIPYTEVLPKAKAELTLALSLDPELDEAWALMGVVHFFEWEHDAAERAVAKALELNPRLAHAHNARACNEMFRGRPERALAPAILSVELDPLSTFWNVVLTLTHLALGDRPSAGACVRSILTFDPESWWAHYLGSLISVAEGNLADALRSAENAVRYSGGAPMVVGALACVKGLAGDREGAERGLAELTARSAPFFVPGLAMAFAHVGLGQTDAAFDCLDKSLAERDVWVTWVEWTPLLAPLRSHPRMTDLMRRLKQLQGR
jgi:serine/threonine-protein kinase